MNRKITNASINNYNGITFKSKLEVMIYKTLQEQGFDVKYEPKKFIIWEGYKPIVPFFDKNPKTGLLKQNFNKLKDVTYTPDFCFEYDNILIIIEAKGFENDVFPLKKKMFRKVLETLNKPVLYFEIYSKKQLLQAIEIIKMAKLSEICEMFVCLPSKDIPIANKLLFNRDFLELKALIDSDVTKLERKRKNNPEDVDDVALEENYLKIIQLKNAVDEQAAAFSNDDIENYYEPDEF